MLKLIVPLGAIGVAATSPAAAQEGFLHQVSPLDTRGIDRPESACTAFEEGE